MQKQNVHRQSKTLSPEFELHRILVPIDFSRHSKSALAYAVSIAEKFGAEVILLYVVERAVIPHGLGFGNAVMVGVELELEKKGKHELGKLVATVVGKSVPARSIIRNGKPYVEILRTAEKENIDLIVIATRGHTEVEQLLFGSTAEKVVSKACCPVLTWRPKSE